MTPPKNNKNASSSEISNIASFYNEMSSSLKELVKSTATLEEKLKTLVETQDEFTDKIEELMQSYNNLLGRIISVESKDLDQLQKDINDNSNRITIIEHDVEIIDDLAELANKHANIISLLENSSKEFKDKLKERSKTIHELVLKIERLSLHKNSTEKLIDTLFKVGTSITIAYIIYWLKIGNS